jgi:sec-independent protein translocase protein TatC
MAERRLTVLGHLSELRRVLIVSLGAWIVLAMLSFSLFARDLLAWLLGPLGRPAIFLGPAEGFMLTFKVALLAGAVLASPVILWQLLWFVLPALRRKEKHLMWILVISGSGAFAAGAVFAYRLLLPAMISFFLGFATDQFRPEIVGSRYVNFVLFLAIGCGVAFELPIITAAMSYLGLVSHRTLLRQWRVAIIGCFAIAAFITPSPDAFTMIMVALPLVVLYLAGIATAALVGGK